MGIVFKRWSNTGTEDVEMSEAAERNYIDMFKAESATYIQDAKSLTGAASGLYWTEADEAIERIAKETAKKRAEIQGRVFSPLNTLNAIRVKHRPLTPELLEERKAAMLEAVEIYRAARYKFAGEIGEEYQRRVDELERKAEAMTVYDGAFDIARYI